MLIPSWIKHREIVWWNYGENTRVLCRVTQVGNEYVVLTILAATTEQVLKIRRGVGEQVQIMYVDGLLEGAR
jgi:hypothetical protein